MKSFDNWLKEQGQPASYFSRREAYNAGAQSKQQELDELIKKLEKSEYLGNEHLEARRRLYKDNCELQKRIDNALSKSKDFYDFGDGESAMAFCNEIINILKGENHES